MKKLLLVAFASVLWLGSQAQSPSASKPVAGAIYAQHKPHVNDAKPVVGSFYTTGVQAAKKQGSNARVATGTGVHIGTAYNAYGVLDASTTAISANQATNLITMTHREGITDRQVGYGTGVLQPSFSTNNGANWDSTFVIFNKDSARYPNGVIYNPTGNVNPKMAYVAVSGPWTNAPAAPAIGWTKTVYGSMRMDSSNIDTVHFVNGAVGVYPQDNGDLSYMTSCSDGRVHVIGTDFRENAAGSAFTTFEGAVITTGKFNGTGFTWTQQVIRPHLSDGFKGFTPTSPYDSLVQFQGVPAMAWSQDGGTGYVVFFGNLDSTGYDFGSYQPIVYKTTDTGVTWTMLPMYNFAKLFSPATAPWTDRWPTADTGTFYPLWNLEGQAQGDENDVDLVVDANKELHIFGSIQGSFYATPGDSSYVPHFFATPAPVYYIYDMNMTTPTGGWKARFIDSLTAGPSYSVNTTEWHSNATTTVNWGARIQASRTFDGSVVFCTWNDDFADATITYPDDYGQAYNVLHNTATPVMTFSSSLDQFFLCVSDNALTTGSYPNATYTIPCSYVASPNGNDGTSPVEFLYQGGVVYTDSQFLGVEEVAGPNGGFSVSNNYPNPFNNTTQFNVNLDKESMVGVDVYNMLGEKIQTIEPKTMEPGMHVITLGGKGMSSGVYFYRVNVNNQVISHKMIIE
jgi:hypothetical protein